MGGGVFDGTYPDGDPFMREQPMPKEGKQDVTPYVIADLQARTRLGVRKYGRPLQTHNGRDALQDAYEEALDLCQYLKQAILERDGTGGDVRTTTYRQADPDDGYWECAKCEAKWVFFDGGPRDNSMAYCPECGRKVVGEVRWGDQADYTPCPTCEELPTWCGCNQEGGGGDE